MNHNKLIIFLFLIINLPGQFVFAQQQTVGLFINSEDSFNGFTLFSPMRYTSTYLIDNNGYLINSWESDFTPANSFYLLENGNLLRTADPRGNPVFIGGGGGLIEEFDWDGNKVWEYRYSNEFHQQHHDIAPLPNGNILLLAWEYKSREETIAAGRNPDFLIDGELWPEHIVEINPTDSVGGEIVWEWHVWDHLIQDFDSTKNNFGIVREHCELADINFGRNAEADWLHANAIDYNELLDQIIITVQKFKEFWIIDHSTTSEEAASHSGGNWGKGGDILYRWGNPQAYRAGDNSDIRFYGVHDAHWIKPGLPGEGNILIFHNGNRRPDGKYSSIEEIALPLDVDGKYISPEPGNAFGPSELTWKYTSDPVTDFHSNFISGSQRLPNGNTLICDGAHGTFFEINMDNEIVWKYVNPVTNFGPLSQGAIIPAGKNGLLNSVFRVYRYAPDYPGLSGRDLIPGERIELDAVTGVQNMITDLPDQYALYPNYPNPFNPSTTIHFTLPKSSKVTLEIYNLLGHKITTLINDADYNRGLHSIKFEANELSSGVYLYKLQANEFTKISKMMVLK